MFSEELTYEQKQKAIASQMFMAEKRDGSIKVRTGADGREQWPHMAKEDAAWPKVTVELIFIKGMICKNREVTVFDLPGAFLHTKR